MIYNGSLTCRCGNVPNHLLKDHFTMWPNGYAAQVKVNGELHIVENASDVAPQGPEPKTPAPRRVYLFQNTDTAPGRNRYRLPSPSEQERLDQLPDRGSHSRKAREMNTGPWRLITFWTDCRCERCADIKAWAQAIDDALLAKLVHRDFIETIRSSTAKATETVQHVTDLPEAKRASVATDDWQRIQRALQTNDSDKRPLSTTDMVSRIHGLVHQAKRASVPAPDTAQHVHNFVGDTKMFTTCIGCGITQAPETKRASVAAESNAPITPSKSVGAWPNPLHGWANPFLAAGLYGVPARPPKLPSVDDAKEAFEKDPLGLALPIVEDPKAKPNAVFLVSDPNKKARALGIVSDGPFKGATVYASPVPKKETETVSKTEKEPTPQERLVEARAEVVKAVKRLNKAQAKQDKAKEAYDAAVGRLRVARGAAGLPAEPVKGPKPPFTYTEAFKDASKDVDARSKVDPFAGPLRDLTEFRSNMKAAATLGHAPKTIGEWAKDTGMSSLTVNDHLKELEREGTVERTWDPNKWRNVYGYIVTGNAKGNEGVSVAKGGVIRTDKTDSFSTTFPNLWRIPEFLWPTQTTPEAAILDEAKKVIGGDRKDSYGDAEDSFRTIGSLWETWLEAAGRRIFQVSTDGGLSVTPLPDDQKIVVFLEGSDVAMLLGLMKDARQAHAPKDDNLVDGIGYRALAKRCLTKEEQ